LKDYQKLSNFAPLFSNLCSLVINSSLEIKPTGGEKFQRQVLAISDGTIGTRCRVVSLGLSRLVVAIFVIVIDWRGAAMRNKAPSVPYFDSELPHFIYHAKARKLEAAGKDRKIPAYFRLGKN